MRAFPKPEVGSVRCTKDPNLNSVVVITGAQLFTAVYMNGNWKWDK
jgi:hypothetical protein